MITETFGVLIKVSLWQFSDYGNLVLKEGTEKSLKSPLVTFFQRSIQLKSTTNDFIGKRVGHIEVLISERMGFNPGIKFSPELH